MRTPHAEFHHLIVAGCLDGACALAVLLMTLPAGAMESAVH
ncbi:MAG: hypothetical protein OEY91_09050 [Nitrospirota bacterium]|nr:hypothetical protein [Nitrospirota bacterium]